MQQTLKSSSSHAEIPVTLMGIRNLLSSSMYRKPFENVSASQKNTVCQTIAAGVSLAMIMPVAAILYFVIQNFV